MSILQSMLLSTQGALAQGVLWGLMVLGVYITYKMLNIADPMSFSLGFIIELSCIDF